MGDLKHYVIRGGLEGRERLKVLSRVMAPFTCAVLDRVGISSGLVCLDLGWGSGDGTSERGRRVSPDGKAIGADIDATKIDLAREEAKLANIRNIEFRIVDSRDRPSNPEFDWFTHASSLLTSR